MGMFCMPKMNGKSGDYVEAAIGNLNIFMESWEHKFDISCSSQSPNDYLLDMTIGLLTEAKEKYIKECAENPNINAPRPPDPLIDIDLALEHAKGDEVEDCSALLCFFRQHPDQINELLGRIDPGFQSKLGVTAVLRYTWQSRDQFPHWQKLINNAYSFYGEESNSLLHGLTQFVDK